MIETELQVGDAELRCAFSIGTYKMPSNLPGTRGPRTVEMVASVHDTVSNSSTNDTRFQADIRSF